MNYEPSTMNFKPILFLFVITCMASTVNAQDLDKYERSVYISKGDTLPYRILFPENFDPAKRYPLMFFLHGSGERGNNNQAQLTHGGKLFLKEEIRKNFPAIVVFPQCLKDSYWSNVNIVANENGKREFHFQRRGKPTEAMALLLGLTKRLTDKPFVNKNQVYVGGLSMGGMGTFEILRREPKLFAAAFAICGGDNSTNVKKYKHVPLWIFHGAKDDIVPPESSEIIVNALQDKGAAVKFTLYPNANHNSWYSAFAEPGLIPWLFSHKK